MYLIFYLRFKLKTKNYVKKIKLSLIGFVAFISLCSLTDPNDPGSTFWGWSYGTPSAVLPEGGTGNCYQSASAQYHIFWIGGSVQNKFRYADCTTGDPIGDWVDSLMGMD